MGTFPIFVVGSLFFFLGSFCCVKGGTPPSTCLAWVTQALLNLVCAEILSRLKTPVEVAVPPGDRGMES
jgi:hypothetical protein